MFRPFTTPSAANSTIYSKTCLKRNLKGPEYFFPLKPGFRLIKVHYIQYKKLNQDMYVFETK